MRMEPRQPRETVGTVGASPAVKELPGSRKPEFTRFNEEKPPTEPMLTSPKEKQYSIITYLLFITFS